jgi:hypothetical protein
MTTEHALYTATTELGLARQALLEVLLHVESHPSVTTIDADLVAARQREMAAQDVLTDATQRADLIHSHAHRLGWDQEPVSSTIDSTYLADAQEKLNHRAELSSDLARTRQRAIDAILVPLARRVSTAEDAFMLAKTTHLITTSGEEITLLIHALPYLNELDLLERMHGIVVSLASLDSIGQLPEHTLTSLFLALGSSPSLVLVWDAPLELSVELLALHQKLFTEAHVLAPRPE